MVGTIIEAGGSLGAGSRAGRGGMLLIDCRESSVAFQGVNVSTRIIIIHP